MKYLYLITLVILSTFKSYSQLEVNKAVFGNCLKEVYPYTCTSDKISDDFYNLINKTILSTTVQQEGNYLTLAILFIVDAEGKLISEDTEIVSNHAPLKIAVSRYLNNLPSFIPKNTGVEKRTLYTYNRIYLYDTETKTYELTTAKDLLKKGLKAHTEKLTSIISPRHPECESIENIEECTSEKIKALMAKKYRFPRNVTGQARMLITFTVDTDGTLIVSEIIGGNEEFRKEAARVLKKLPKLIPAEVKGLPIKTGYNLPLTINIT